MTEFLSQSQFVKSKVALFVTLTVFIVCMALAQWQLQRATQKQQRLDQIHHLQNKGTLSLSQFSQLPENTQKSGLRLLMEGQLLERYWLLDNRIYKGRIGYDLLVMVRDFKNQLWLVNLGWVAAPNLRTELPDILLPQNIKLDVHLEHNPTKPFSLAASANDSLHANKVIQYLDLTFFKKAVNQQIQPFIAYAVSENKVAQIHYEAVVMSPQKHQAYALQWLLIGIGAVIVFIAASIKKRNQHE